ncbi:MAG TPA: hypothetical protein VI758_06820 [Bacteroidota bacterium]
MLDLKKLKIQSYRNILLVNFPGDIDPGIRSTKTGAEVIIYYIGQIGDVRKFIDLCNSTPLPKNNRTIMVYRKGRTDGVGRDTIISPFRKKHHKGFALKAPMLCSLSDELSAFVLSKVSEP